MPTGMAAFSFADGKHSGDGHTGWRSPVQTVNDIADPGGPLE